MQLQAILHIPLSNYAYAVDEHTLTIRIRAAKGDLNKCTLYYGDRVCTKNPIDVTEVNMERAATDDLFDYFEAVISDEYTRVCYYFLVEDNTQKLYYSEYGFSEEMTCSRTQYFQFPYIRKEDIADIPSWAEEMVMYHIFPDSFADGKHSIKNKGKHIEQQGVKYDSIHGGTLRGIIENVDYIKDLGVNCVYLNPVFAAASYHKYDTVDYFEIDPCFGTKEDLRELTKKLHDNGIRIILDGVFNHCGSQFHAFSDVLKNGEKSEYKDWFYKLEFPVSYTTPPNYEAFAYVREMPKLNTGNKKVVDYFCNVGAYWIKEADIDGWRLDVANEINHDFWRAFRKAVRKEKTDALLIGEIWEDSNVWLMGDQFDSTMNYTFTSICQEYFTDNKLSVREFDEKINKMLFRYPLSVSLVQMNFLDTHDVPRFLFYCKEDKKLLRAAVLFLMTCPGIPSVFYGDEQGISGDKEEEYRAPMRWNNGDKELENFYKKCIAIRRELIALQKGNYRTLCIDEAKRLYGFRRECRGEEVLVFIQISNQDQIVEIPEKYRGKLFDCFSKEPLKEDRFTLESMEGKIFKVIENE